MRRFLLPLLLVASLSASVPAMAADMSKPAVTPPAKPAETAPAKPAVTTPAKPVSHIHTTTGVIKSIDTKACLIVLTNKDVFHVRGKCDALAKVKVGEKVTVTWYARNSRDWATRITAA
jgi:hypothetical protein